MQKYKIEVKKKKKLKPKQIKYNRKETPFLVKHKMVAEL